MNPAPMADIAEASQKNAHTPGPLRIERGSKNDDARYIYGPIGMIATVHAYAKDGDAAMFAAAPDLLGSEQENLTVLKNLLAYLRKHEAQLPPVSLSSLEVQIEKTRAAISRATEGV